MGSSYPEAVRRRKGVIFGRLSRKNPSSVDQAAEVLQASYPQFRDDHSNLVLEWWETRDRRQTAAVKRKRPRKLLEAPTAEGKPAKKRGRPRKTVAPQVRRRGRPRDVDRVVAGLPASALKVVTRSFGSSKEFLEVQKAVKQLGGPSKVLALFKLFNR